MSGLLHHVAGAALPVAIALLCCAAAARVVLWGRFDDASLERMAREHLEPLSTWCLVAVGVSTFAFAAAGDASVLSVALAVGLAAGAVLVRPTTETIEREAVRAQPTAEPAVAPAPEPRVEPVAAPAPIAPDSLWARRAGERTRGRGELWRR